MKRMSASPSGRSAISSIELKRAWDITYDTGVGARGWNDRRPGYIALRTFAGEGRMDLRTGRSFNLTADTLFFVERASIHGHQAIRPWHLWWFYFGIIGTLPFPVGSVISAPVLPDEQTLFQTVFKNLGRGEEGHQRVAVAAFSLLLHHWVADYVCPEAASTRKARVEAVITYLHQHLGDGVTVKDMAKRAGMSATGFRTLFRRITGVSPKFFYDGLRLNNATDALQLGASIRDVSEELGYSSPYHFSREFKKRFGTSPGKARGKAFSRTSPKTSDRLPNRG